MFDYRLAKSVHQIWAREDFVYCPECGRDAVWEHALSEEEMHAGHVFIWSSIVLHQFHALLDDLGGVAMVTTVIFDEGVDEPLAGFDRAGDEKSPSCPYGHCTFLPSPFIAKLMTLHNLIEGCLPEVIAILFFEQGIGGPKDSICRGDSDKMACPGMKPDPKRARSNTLTDQIIE